MRQRYKFNDSNSYEIEMYIIYNFINVIHKYWIRTILPLILWEYMYIFGIKCRLGANKSKYYLWYYRLNLICSVRMSVNENICVCVCCVCCAHCVREMSNASDSHIKMLPENDSIRDIHTQFVYVLLRPPTHKQRTQRTPLIFRRQALRKRRERTV